MSDLFLYYAGTADDLENEQIGLAVSRDGGPFQRVGDEGLIVRRDEAFPWRALRVCNPTVVEEDRRLVMYYQGIAHGLKHTSLGRATSTDGIAWELDDEPFLAGPDMAAVDPGLDAGKRVGLTAPAVLVEGGRVRMWFIYIHPSQPGNSLWYAERSVSETGWRLAPQPVLTGANLGGHDLHYPQVVPVEEGFELWFTLRNLANGVDGVFVAGSNDGETWGEPVQLLPRCTGGGIRLEPRHAPLAARSWTRVLGRRAVAKLDWEIGKRVQWSNRLGYAHPHVYGRGPRRSIAIHNCNLGPRGRWLDISVGTLAGGRIDSLKPALRTGRPGAWDAYFVGDPFVLER